VEARQVGAWEQTAEDKVVWLDLDAVKQGISPRAGGLDRAHVLALSEVKGRWPPILVCRRDSRVIDGHHRLAAARLLGQTQVAAIWFDGDGEDAYVEAVRRNITHGLPLTLDDRRAAARQLLVRRPQWSDRSIGAVCGLSPRTVSRVRAAIGQQTTGGDFRIGRDGRLRRVSPRANHRLIIEAVKAQPGASLRSIAQSVGTSPETVRRVRQSLHQVDGGLTNGLAVPDPSNAVPVVSPRSEERCPVWLCPPCGADTAMMSTPDGKRFAEWYDRTDPGEDSLSNVDGVPLSRAYEVADGARRRARVWISFAKELEERTRARRAGG
jgi:hypothetical protein